MKDDNNKTFGKNFIISICVTIIIGLVNVAFPLLIGLLYGPEILGNFSVLFYYSTLISIPIANGIAPAVTRFIAASESNDSKVIRNLGIKITSNYFIVIAVLFSLFGLLFFGLNIFDVIIVLLLIALTTIHHIYRKSSQGQEKFQTLLKNEVISFSIFVPFMVIFNILPIILDWGFIDNFYLLFLPLLIYHLVFNLISIIPDFRLFKLKSLFKFPGITRKVLKYSFFVGLGSIFGLGISQIQIIISKNYLSEFELGVLSFWNSAMAPILLLAVTLSSILVPRITNLSLTRKDLIYPLVNYINYGITLIVYPLIGLIHLLIEFYPSFLDYLTLSKYQMTVYWLIPVLISFQVVSSLLSSISISYFSSSEKRIIFNPISSFIYSISVIISWIFLVPRYGIFGFAGGMALGGFVINFVIQIIAIIITKRRIGMHIFLSIGLFISNGICMMIYPLWFMKFGIIVWSIITAISLVFGICIIRNVLKNQEYSANYKSVNNFRT